MALHFSGSEFERRMEKTLAAMAERELDALLIFSQESMYWLTGYDSFGFCFFQSLVLTADGKLSLLTRSPDLRQARHTSNIEDIHIWFDRGEKSPVSQLRDLVYELDLLGKRIGVEYDTHGLTAFHGRELDHQFHAFAEIEDASRLISRLRMVKSAAEIVYIRDAARLTEKALAAGLEEIRPGADEAVILARMQNAVLAGGGDYPANSFVIGSAEDALLCRYKTGRRALSENDQLTLEFAGVYRHYHVAMMHTVVVGQPTERHHELYEGVSAALDEVEAAMRPGSTFGDVFNAHATELDARGLGGHRLNACGYSLGARFAPSWMDWPMFYRGNEIEIEPNMCLFAHMVLMDSETGTAMCLGRTYLTTEGDPEPLTARPDGMIVRT